MLHSLTKGWCLYCYKYRRRYLNVHPNIRSSCLEVFCKKSVLKNLAKFTGKHLCRSFFFNKVAGLRPATLSQKRLWHRCFPLNFAKFSRTPFLTAHLRCLFLKCLSLWKYLSFSEFKVGPSPSKKNCSICFNKTL